MAGPIKTESKPHFAYNVLLVVTAIVFCIAVQIPFFRFVAGRHNWNDPILYFSLAAMAIFVGTLYLLVGIKVFRAKVNRFLALLFAIMAIGGIVGSLAHGSILTNAYGEYSVCIDDANGLVRIESAVNALLTSYGLFLLYALDSSTRKSKASGFIIAEIVIIWGVFSVLYSLIAQWGEYMIALERGFSRASITSFCGQKNVYAGYLLLALFAEMIQLERDNRRIRHLMMGFFVAAIVFTASKAAIVIAPISVIAYWIYRAILLKKEGRFEWKGIVFPAIVVGTVIVGISVIANLKPAFFASLYISFSKFFQETDASNVSTRLEIWKAGFDLTASSPVSFIFGHGDVIYSYLLTPVFRMQYMATSHNFLVEIFGRGGLVRVLVLVGLITYLARSYVLAIKRGVKGLFVPFMAMAFMLFRECIEYTFILDMALSTAVFLYVVMLPPIADYETKEISEEKALASFNVRSAIRFAVPVLLSLGFSAISLAIPASFGWIAPLSVTAIIGAYWGISHVLKRRFFSHYDCVALLLAMAILSPLTAASPSEVITLGVLFAPAALSFAWQTMQASFSENAGCGWAEYQYSRFLHRAVPADSAKGE